MVIAVNTTVLVNSELDYKSNFVREVFKRITQQNLEHQFIFIFSTPYNEDLLFSKNIRLILVKSSSQNKLALKYWYDIKLPIALKKYKPDLLIQINDVCSSVVSIPQLLVLNENISTKKNIAKAKAIIVSSPFIKTEIVEKNKVDTNKISVVYGAAQPCFKQLSFDEIIQVKDAYTSGREFFLLPEDDNLMNVLKAFSMFKKWQHSNMKLLVVASTINQNKKMLTQLETYKYRDDVILLSNIDEDKLAKLTASAYCVINSTLKNKFHVHTIEAMQSGVPIIASNNVPESIDIAALYAPVNDSQKIAEQMQLIYKDEILRSKLINEGLEKCTNFSWDKTAELVWDSILKSVK